MICVGPTMAPWMTSAENTFESSTIAVAVPTCAAVNLAHVLAAPDLKVSSTSHCVPVCESS